MEKQKLTGRNIKLNIKANFPENTNLLIELSRRYYQRGKSEAYSGEIFLKDIPVKSGKIELNTEINDSIWYSGVLNKVSTMPDVFPKPKNISKNVKLFILFSPMRRQPIDVLKILGDKGDFIKGKGIDRLGKITTFKFSKNLNISFKK